MASARSRAPAERRAVWVWLIALFIFLASLSFTDPFLLWDENAYLGNARDILGGSAYSEDFRFPLLGYMVASVWLFTGESLLAAKLLMVLVTVATSYAFYLVCRRHFSGGFSLLVAALFSVSSQLIFWGIRVYADVPSVLFMVLSFYFLAGIKRPYYPAIAGAFCTLAFMAKFSAALFLVSGLAYLLIMKRPKAAAVMAFAALLVALPWFSADYVAHGDPFHNIRAQMGIISAYTAPEPVEKHFSNFLVAFNGLILLLPGGIYALWKKKPEGWQAVFIFLAAFFVYFAFFVNLKDIRYYLMALPFLFILAGYGIEWASGRFGRRSLLIALAMVVVGVSSSFTVYDIAQRGYCEAGGSMEQSIDYVCPMLQEGDMVISNFWPYFGYYCNTGAVSTWDKFSALLAQYNPRYIILHEWYGIEPPEEDTEGIMELEKAVEGRCGGKVYIYRPLV